MMNWYNILVLLSIFISAVIKLHAYSNVDILTGITIFYMDISRAQVRQVVTRVGTKWSLQLIASSDYVFLSPTFTPINLGNAPREANFPLDHTSECNNLMDKQLRSV